MADFPDEIVAAVLAHMNSDHTGDNLIIVQAFAEPTATSARMSGLDDSGGEWSASVDGVERPVRIPWGTPVTERSGIRREVVVLYRAACARLGLVAREH
jgi:hypothetical protein